MNEVPLIQNVQKNDINTSIIAIKKQLKQLIEAVGLIESPNSPDMSPYVKKTDIVDYVQIGNQNPVTSNGVYVALTELEERIDENIVDNVENGDLRPVTSNAVSQSISYSTTEQKTGGIWIDGKPIYRRAYYSATNWANNTVLDTISNIGTVIQIRDVTSTGGGMIYQNYGEPANQSNCTTRVNTATGQVIVARTSSFANNKPSTVIIEYTKTTNN